MGFVSNLKATNVSLVAVFVVVAISVIKGDTSQFQQEQRGKYSGLAGVEIFVDASESEAKFAIDSDSTVAFSQNTGGKYRILSFNSLTGEYRYISKEDTANVRQPFILDGKIWGLRETESSKELAPSDGMLAKTIGSRSIEKVSPSINGQTVIIKFDDSDSIFIWYRDSGKLNPLLTANGNLEAVSFSTEGNAVISTSNGMFLYDRLNGRIIRVDIPLDGQKLNPSLCGDNVYFSSSAYSDYYEIFGYNIGSKKLSRIKFGRYDYKLPRRQGNKVYYIKIDRSQYLLEYLDVTSNECTNLVPTGVVYDYHISGNQVYFTFSDIKTPRCLKAYNTRTKTIQNINCSEYELDVRAIFNRSPDTSPAYIWQPRHQESIRGILLYFHPGKINDDYSPRWDNMIVPFCLNGYVIVAPNFPTSGGYGKRHAQRSRQDAAEDMVNWKRKIEKLYPGKPIFYYGISTGCALMEAALARDRAGIAGIVSSFGLEPLELDHEIPSIFSLGEKDPIIPVKQRVRQLELMQTNRKTTYITILGNETHWIQNEAGFLEYYSQVIPFLNNLTSRYARPSWP